MPKVHYYYTAWSIYGRAYPPGKVPNHVNSVTYSFLDLKPNAAGLFVPTLSDAWADTDKKFAGAEALAGAPPDGPSDPYSGNLGQFRKMKAMKPLEFSLSIGGWTFSKNFSDAVATPQAREAFVDTLVEMVTKKWPGLVDALDFDWEFISPAGKNYGNAGNVVRAEDGANFVEMLKLLKAKLAAAGAPNVKITVAVTAAPEKMDALPVEAMNPLLDEWRLMTYDFGSSAFGPCKATHHTNLYPSSVGHTPYSISGAVAAYMARGVAPNKIFIGAALYSRGFANTEGLGKAANGVVKNKSWEDGVSDYKALPPAGAVEYWDDECKASYCYDPATKDLNSYDTPRSVAEKAKFIHEKGLGGMFFWEISGDREDEKSLSRWAFEHLEAPDSSLDKVTKAVTSLAAGQMPALAPVPEIAAPVPVQAPVVAAPPAGPPPLPSAPATEWSGAAVTYPAGAKVTFQGKSFVCTLAHNSQADWMPGAAVSLWQPVA